MGQVRNMLGQGVSAGHRLCVSLHFLCLLFSQPGGGVYTWAREVARWHDKWRRRTCITARLYAPSNSPSLMQASGYVPCTLSKHFSLSP